jgi:hypothetical protein
MASLACRDARSLIRCLLFAAVLLVVWLAASPAGWAQTDAGPGVPQQQVEAAFLYKFGGYVTWPDKAFAGPDSPIVIGVAGADLLADDLASLVAGRTIGNRPVVVRHIHGEGALVGVHILFIGAGHTAQAESLLEANRGQPILTVTEGENGLSEGSAISFVVVDNRVRFDVSLDAAQHNGLRLSSLLLSVAHAVSGKQP